ncbi:hypothetical protein MTO96_021824 [Rhipicephalus appendiculatus]
MADYDSTPSPVSEEDFEELKKRLQMIFDADPEQFHNDYSIKRFLRAFRTIDAAFQAILKCNKWRTEYGVKSISANDPDIKRNIEAKKAMVLPNRDFYGRPVIYIPACKHNVQEREIDELTRFIVYILEEACKKCFEEVHYPERLGICLILNSPTIFSGCWSVIRGWLNEVTAKKVVFIGSQDDLVKYVHPDILPNL